MAVVNMSTKFPAQLVSEMFNLVKGKSSVAKMSGAAPIPFVGTDIFTFNFSNKLSVVGESGQKPAGDAAVGTVQIRPIKVVYQARFSDEFMYAGEEYRLNTLRAFADGFARILASGIDEMVLHGVNPATGSSSAVIGNNHADYVINAYSSNANTETWTSGTNSPIDKLEAVLAKIPEANGIIMGPTMRTAIAGIKETSSSTVPTYAAFQFGGAPDNLGACKLDINTTVEANSSKDRAFVANWDAFKWGFAKELPLEIIEYGNPDGGSYDLKNVNQILLRSEAFVGWGFIDPSQFGRVVAP